MSKPKKDAAAEEPAPPIHEGMADRLELWPIADLEPYARNPRRHPEAQVRAIAESIQRLGFNQPILVDGKKGIVAGHGRYAAAKLLGLERVPVVPLDHLDEHAAAAYRIADNRLAELSGWDVDDLEAELRELAALDDLDVGVTGFELEDLDDLEQLLDVGERKRTPRRAEAPEPGEPPERPVSRVGDLWILGRHRLVCGDCYDDDVVARALDGAKADAVLTDPPYAIYGSSTGVDVDAADDRMVRPTFERILRAAARHVRMFAHVYHCCDWRSWPAWWEAGRGTGLVVKNLLVWEKPGPGMGSMWGNGYELLGFWVRVDKRTGMFTERARGHRQVHRNNVLKANRAAGGDDAHEGKRKTDHNAQKPVELLEQVLAASVVKGELVLDLFGGSGSLAVACERHGEDVVSATVEIEPKWVDVTVRRWQAISGEKARLGRAKGATFETIARKRAEEK